DAPRVRRRARRPFRGGGNVRQILVDRAAHRARHCRAHRPPPRHLFLLAGALGDDRGGGARARAAPRLADWERLCSVLLCGHLARGRFVGVDAGRLARLSRGQHRLCRAAAPARAAHGAAERRSRQGHGMAAGAATPLCGGRVLGGAADPRRDRAVSRVRLVSLWSMSAFTLLPVMLLSSPLVALARRDAVRVLTVAVALPVVMVAAAPAVAFVIHRAGPPPGSVHASVLAEPIERLWRETTDAPLRFFGGFDEFTDGVTFYMRSHPLAVHVLDSTVSPAVEER